MSENFVRRINANYERYDYDYEVSASTDPGRRGLINEFSFEIFRQLRADGGGVNKIDYSDISKYYESVQSNVLKKIAAIENRSVDEFHRLTSEEVGEAIELINSLIEYLRKVDQNKSHIIAPRFEGCGFIDACFGDIYYGDCLSEVKAGDRKFRAVDLRQLLVYAALNYIGGNLKINKIELVNPRRHIHYRCSLDEACVAMSGQLASECLYDIVRFITGMGGCHKFCV